MTNWIIYKLTCETGKTYIGKTCMTMNRRLTKHKGRQNKESNSSTKDFINPIIEQIDTTDNKETSFYLEQHHIRQNIDCCNIVKLLSKEEKIIRKAEVSKKYSQTEKGKISMTLCKKRWYEKHKDVLNEKLRVKRLLKKNILI
tara:strand:- start:365 stop:793 length:429 start_codon:yes stop_codon:yes gene_type:complete